MTRINLTPVVELSDQHLIAEYRELPRMGSFEEKTIKLQGDIPVTFTLNKGHMTFFLDKARFLEKRHKEIVEECLRREINIKNTQPFRMKGRFKQKEWVPNDHEIQISRKRIEERISQKPSFYTWCGKKRQ